MGVENVCCNENTNNMSEMVHKETAAKTTVAEPAVRTPVTTIADKLEIKEERHEAFERLTRYVLATIHAKHAKLTADPQLPDYAREAPLSKSALLDETIFQFRDHYAPAIWPSGNQHRDHLTVASLSVDEKKRFTRALGARTSQTNALQKKLERCPSGTKDRVRLKTEIKALRKPVLRYDGLRHGVDFTLRKGKLTKLRRGVGRSEVLESKLGVLLREYLSALMGQGGEIGGSAGLDGRKLLRDVVGYEDD
jgi:hypothetical protein